MSVRRVYVLSITCIICTWLQCITGQSESCRANYNDNCLANSTLCSPYTVSSSSRCNFVRCCCSEYASEEAMVNYLFFQYCSIWSTSLGFSNKEVPNAILLGIMAIYFVLILGNVADRYFAPIMAETADTLGVSHNIAGVTFLAFANGAPDISSGVAAIQHGGEQTKLGLGALLGVAVFNPILISSVISTYAVSEPIKVVRFPFARDCIFLFLAACIVLKISLSGKIVLIEALGMIFLYITYVTTAVCSEIYNKRKKKQRLQGMQDGHGDAGKYKSLDAKTDRDDDDKDNDEDKLDDPDKYQPSAKHLWMSLKSEATQQNIEDDDKHNKEDKHWCLKVTHIILLILRGPTFVTNYLCQLTIPLTDEEHWNDWLSVISCTTAPMMIFFVFELFDVELYIIPLWIPVLTFGVIMSNVTYYLCQKKYKNKKRNNSETDITFTDNSKVTKIELHSPKLSESMQDKDDKEQQQSIESQPVMKYFFLVLGFLVSVSWINLAAVEVVNILSTLGVVSTIDLSILGLTVLAWGNSTPDIVADVGVSKRGYAKMGIAAAIGGPTLDVLIGVGLGTTLVCLEHGEAIIPISTNIFFGCLGVMAGISSYLGLVAFNGMTVNKYIGYFLFCYYVTFLAVNIMSYQFNVTVV